jgi:hypothetical protein
LKRKRLKYFKFSRVIMGDSENSLGVINTRETSSATDAAVALVETLIDGCVDRETLRKKFMERFGGDRHAARTYFSLAHAVSLELARLWLRNPAGRRSSAAPGS